MSVGLVGPEFTLHMSWIQFVLARWVVREMGKGGKRSVQTILSYLWRVFIIALLVFYRYFHMVT